MKIGVRAHDFGRMKESELAKTIKQAKINQLGFETVQLAITKAILGIEKFTDITDDLLESIRNEFDKNAIDISVLGCYVEPSLLDKEKRTGHINNFKLGIEHAKKLGVKIVGTETTNFDLSQEDMRESTYQILKDSVLRMVEKAEKENITIGIEPVADHTLNSPELTRRLLDEVQSEKLKIIFDPVNMILPSTIHNQNKIFADCFKYFGNEIVAVHIKDIIIEDNQKVWTNIGDGLINYNFIFDWLLKNKPDISILREGIKADSYEKDIVAMKKLSVWKNKMSLGLFMYKSRKEEI